MVCVGGEDDGMCGDLYGSLAPPPHCTVMCVYIGHTLSYGKNPYIASTTAVSQLLPSPSLPPHPPNPTLTLPTSSPSLGGSDLPVHTGHVPHASGFNVSPL